MKKEKILIETLKRLGYKWEKGIFRLYQTVEEGIGVYLPGWKYPIVIKKDGTIAYDNYNGKWGNIFYLNKLKKEYAFQSAKYEMERKGYRLKTIREKNGKRLVEFVKI